MEGSTGFKLMDELEVAAGGGDFYDDAEADEAGAEPERGPAVGLDGELLNGLDLAEKEAETSDDEAESHEREAGAEPGEVGAFGGEKDAGVGGGVGTGGVRDEDLLGSWMREWLGVLDALCRGCCGRICATQIVLRAG